MLLSPTAAKRRARTLTREAFGTPTLALLGLTKLTEAILVGGPADAWAAFTAAATLFYILGHDLQHQVEEKAGEVAESAAEKADEATGGDDS